MKEIWKEIKNESVIDFDNEVSNYGYVLLCENLLRVAYPDEGRDGSCQN